MAAEGVAMGMEGSQVVLMGVVGVGEVVEVVVVMEVVVVVVFLSSSAIIGSLHRKLPFVTLTITSSPSSLGVREVVVGGSWNSSL